MAEKRPFRDVNGILLLDKPQGLSSNQALQRARHIFAAKKAGHTGSLDPLATGLLPICFGEATKFAGPVRGSHKAYDAECLLGVTTNTDDADGEALARRPVPAQLDIETALTSLRGRITQIPPKFAAIKLGGVALYKRARRGEDIDVPSREVEVFRFEMLERKGDTLSLHVECGSGTYVRSLVRDLGEILGCGAHLTSLRRLWVDPFRSAQSWTLEQLAGFSSAARDDVLLPIEQGLSALPELAIDAEDVARLRHGKTLSRPAVAGVPLLRACDSMGSLIALVSIDAAGTVRVKRGFN